MMKMKRAVMIAVLAVALAALAVPVVGLRARASNSKPAAPPAPSPPSANALSSASTAASASSALQSGKLSQLRNGLYSLETSDGRAIDPGSPGQISRDALDRLGHRRVENARQLSARLNEALQSRLASNSNRSSASQSSELAPQSGQPTVLNARSALSAALIVNIGGRDTQFSEVALVADWDGREDCAADREQKVDDFSTLETDIDTVQTDVAISEHTVANGFAENVYYYGDSLGNLWKGTDIVPGINTSAAAAIDALLQINIPTLINTGASGGFAIANASSLALGCTDDQVVVTGIAVQPVADLSDFPTVACGTIGEVVYVSVQDSEGCSSNAQNQVVRSRILAFPFVDGVGAGAMTPAGTTPTALQIYASSLSNVAGLTVDDDGSLYFHQVDLIQFTGGAIFKATERLHVSRVRSSKPTHQPRHSWHTDGDNGSRCDDHRGGRGQCRKPDTDIGDRYLNKLLRAFDDLWQHGGDRRRALQCDLRSAVGVVGSRRCGRHLAGIIPSPGPVHHSGWDDRAALAGDKFCRLRRINRLLHGAGRQERHAARADRNGRWIC